MHALRKQVTLWVSIVALTVTLGGRASAAIYECAFALDKETISKLGDKHVIKVKDSVYHKTFTLDLGSATLTTLRPGDVVMAHGEAHIVLEIKHRTQWTQFILVDREDIDRFTDLLPSQ